MTAPNIDLDLLWGLSLFFVGLAAIYFISVFFFRNNISSRAAKTKARKTELSPMISEFLFYEEDADKTEKSNYIDLKIQIRELLKNDFNRQILIEILLNLRKDVAGDTQKRLFKLYLDLGLDKDGFKKLESWRWEVISKGILELTQMHVEEAYGFITKFINHKRSTIRKQAEIATVTLKSEGINYFLDTTRYKISEWQQLKLLDVLRNQEDFEPPRFKFWLTSNNKHVVLFALRLIKYYNQNDTNDALIELIKHRNNQIKDEAIACIRDFNVVEALPVLKAVFWKCNVDIKIAILGTIAGLGEDRDIEFLRKVAESEGNFAVNSKALSAINVIAPGTIMPTEGIVNVAYDSYVPEDEEEKVGTEADTVLENSAETGDPETILTSPSEVLADDVEEVKFEEKSIEVEHMAQKEFEKNEPSKKPSDEAILAIWVDDFELVESEPIVTEEELSLEEEEEQNPETDNESVLLNNFLPIVTTEIEKVESHEKYRPMKHSENSEMDLNNIEVYAEVVLPIAYDIEEKTKGLDFDISDIDFLPIVIEDETETGNEIFEEEENKMNMTVPRDIEVFYEELLQTPFGNDLFSLVTEVNDLDFLPIVTDGNIVSNKETGQIEKKGESSSSKDLEGYTLSDFEVMFEEVQAPSEEIERVTVEFDLDDEPIIDLELAETAERPTWLLIQNEINDINVTYEIVTPSASQMLSDSIPEPIYYDEHEAYMMGLLDDLEELGDYREIPLLEELMVQENKIFIKERITSLIEQFASEEDGRRTIKTNSREKEELPVFSVFADLFQFADTESKLILLDEVAAVGDEKELDFLDGLLEDPNDKIRKKARIALKGLIEKLAQKNSETTTFSEQKPTCQDDTGHLNMTDESVPEEYNVLLNTMQIDPPLDNEIFDIDFEIAEVLDKRCDKKILNMPVIATEVSSNESGGSFFQQWFHFSKKK